MQQSLFNKIQEICPRKGGYNMMTGFSQIFLLRKQLLD